MKFAFRSAADKIICPEFWPFGTATTTKGPGVRVCVPQTSMKKLVVLESPQGSDVTTWYSVLTNGVSLSTMI